MLKTISVDAVSGSLLHASLISLSVANAVYAYVTPGNPPGLSASNRLIGFAIDANTGAIQALPPKARLPNSSVETVSPQAGEVFVFGLQSAGSPVNALTLSSFRVDLATGSLDPTQTLQTISNPPGTEQYGLVIHPSGKFLYLQQPACVVAYLVDPATGYLTASSCTPLTLPLGITFSLTIPPPGDFGYAAVDLHSGLLALSDLYSFSVNQADGSLVQVQAPERFGGSTPRLTSAPLGHTLYASIPGVFPPSGCGGVKMWAINKDTGSLTRGPDAVPCFAGEISFTPDGKYSYITGSDAYGIRGIYANHVDPATGNLTDVPGSPFALNCNFAVVEPTQGKFLFCASESTITVWAIDRSTGALSQVPGRGATLPSAFALRMVIVSAGH